MCSGTEFLVLKAPVSWWPHAEELHQYPLNPQRTFFSFITNDGAAIGAGRRLLSLSRLGKSVVIGGRFRVSSTSTSQHLAVYDPFSGMETAIPFSIEGVESAKADIKSSMLSGATLKQLVDDDRVRVTAAPLVAAVPLRMLGTFLLQEGGENGGRDPESKGRYRGHMNGDGTTNDNFGGGCDAFGMHYLDVALRHLTRQLERTPRPSLCSILFSGQHGVGKTHMARQLLDLVPPVVDICGRPYLVEHRTVCISALLLLSEREAVAAVQAVFALPLVNVNAEKNNGVNGVEPCGALLLVTLEGADLLAAISNPLVALITHQLCMVLDKLEQRKSREVQCTVVTLTTAECTKSIPITLLSRLGQRVVEMAYPTLLERLHFIEKRCGVADSTGCYAHCVVERAAEVLGGRSVSELKAIKGEEILQLLEREAALHSREEYLARSRDTNVSEEYNGLVGLSGVIHEVEELVVWPLQQRKFLGSCGVELQKGLVVYGPPGSGKTAFLTRLARRLKSIRVHVLLVDGLSLIEKEVGRTEKNIAALFAAARASSPSAIFLDNIDSLAPPRGRETGEVSNTTDRSLSTLLTEMDGIGGGHTGSGVPLVVVVAAAPSPEALDAAISRPGRLDIHITLPLPATETLQQHIVDRMIQAVEACDGSEIALSDFTADVGAHVARWLKKFPQATVADANHFVQEVLLRVVVEPDGVAGAKHRLQKFLAEVVPM